MSQLANRNDLKALINSDVMKKQFALSLPKHLSPERFARIAITALTRTPKLAECTQESLMKCLLDLSAFGLEPDGRRAHLIPYGNVATLILDWKGLAELALRSGMIAKLHADVVCENDQFEYNMGEVTKHVIDWHKPRGDMYAAYAMAQTKTGEKFFAVMSKDEVEGIRKRSKSGNSGPWQTDYQEMAKKTAFRRLAKWLPLSAEFREAVDKDDDSSGIERDVTNTPRTLNFGDAPVEEPPTVDLPIEPETTQMPNDDAATTFSQTMNEYDIAPADALAKLNKWFNPARAWKKLSDVPESNLREALNQVTDFIEA